MPRTVIVGDVHGCLAELEDLLERVGLGAADRLVLVGDLVARGPDSAGVVALARRLGARAVRGNHEDRALARRAAGGATPGLELSTEDWDYLASLPLTLSLPEHGVLVVHAGLVPGVAIDQQEPRWLMRLRSLDDAGAPSERALPVRWSVRWAGPEHVVFGHHALAGLQLEAFATGLDTGCVYGKELTALCLEAGEAPASPSRRRAQLTQVRARRAWFVPRAGGEA